MAEYYVVCWDEWSHTVRMGPLPSRNVAEEEAAFLEQMLYERCFVEEEEG